MPSQKVSAEEFVDVWNKYRHNTKVAEVVGTDIRQVIARRRRLAKNGYKLEEPMILSQQVLRKTNVVPMRREATIVDGCIMIFSDAHFWPKERTVAFRALLRLEEQLKPKRMVANGDVIDGGKTSRHAAREWDDAPTLAEEVFASQARMGEIKDAAPKGCAFDFNVGNHDNRLDGWLANKAPEVEGLPGTTLAEYFPDWGMAYSLHINAGQKSHTVIKHRYKGGKFADANNVLNAGTHFVTGHDHMLNVYNWADFTGRKYGVRTGQLSEPYGEQFRYAEDNPRAHCSGFAVLTYVGGKLLHPELCVVDDGVAYFRGQKVKT